MKFWQQIGASGQALSWMPVGIFSTFGIALEDTKLNSSSNVWHEEMNYSVKMIASPTHGFFGYNQQKQYIYIHNNGTLGDVTTVSDISPAPTRTYRDGLYASSHSRISTLLGEGSRAKLVYWKLPTTNGDVQISGVGFQPKTVIHFWVGTFPFDCPSFPIPNKCHSNAIGFGAMNATNQWASCMRKRAEASGVLGLHLRSFKRGQHTDACIILPDYDEASPPDLVGTLVSMDSDGFTINFSIDTDPLEIEAEQDIDVVSLCLDEDVCIGAFNKDSSGSSVNQDVSTPGITPGAILLCSFQAPTNANSVRDARQGVGLAISGKQFCVAQNSEDPISVHDPVSSEGIFRDDRCFIVSNAHSVQHATANLVDLQEGKFTLNWVTNNAEATEICFVAFPGTAGPYHNYATLTQYVVEALISNVPDQQVPNPPPVVPLRRPPRC